MNGLFTSFLSLLLLISVTTFGQIKITGNLYDQENQEPLTGAIVQFQHLKAGTISGQHGSFTLELDSLPVTLIISHFGYKTQQLLISQAGHYSSYLMPDQKELNAVVVSGVSAVPLKNIPTSVQVISPEMLLRDASFTTSNAINRTPGVYMHAGALNTSRITIRGIGSRSPYGTNKVKAYYEDIPLTDGSGNSSLEDIDQSLIGRMEITKGPNSSLYGAGLGGAIRLHTQLPTSPFVQSSMLVGSFGTSRYMISGGVKTKSSAIQLSMNQLHSDGYRENSEYDRKQVGLNVHADLNSKNSLTILGIFTDLKAYIPSSIGLTDFTQNPEKAAFTWKQSKGYESYTNSLMGITYTHRFEQDWVVKTTFFGKQRNAYEPRPFNILAENTVNWGNRTLLQKQWDMTHLTLGMELFADRYDWQLFENNYTATSNGSVKGNKTADQTENRKYANAFAELQLELTTQWTLTGGINLNTTGYQLSDQFQPGTASTQGHYSYIPTLSPKLGTVYHLGVRNHLFANISQGFSIPSLEETLTPEGQINPDIKPETGWNYELGWRGTHRHLQYDLTAYFMHIQNLLVARRIGDDQYMGVNAGLNNHLGLDALVNYYLELGPRYTLNLFTSGSWMHFRFAEFVDEETNYNGNELTGVPQLLLNPGIELLTETGFYANVNAQIVGKMPMNDANSLYTDAYAVVRSKVGYRINWQSLIIDLHAGVDNLLDSHYASMILINATAFGTAEPRYYYPGLPRNWYGGVMVKWRF